MIDGEGLMKCGCNCPGFESTGEKENKNQNNFRYNLSIEVQDMLYLKKTNLALRLG